MKSKVANFQRFFNFGVLALLSLIGFIVFRNLLKFGLASDEYRTILYFKGNFLAIDPYSLKSLIPYGGSAFLVMVINLFVGYEPQWFYIVSVLLRIIAAFSLYLLANSIFKDKFIGLTASLLFVVSYAGVQTSAPANMGTYLAIAFMNFGLIKLFKYLENKDKKLLDKTLLTAYVWFLLAISFNAVRMHGLIPLVLTILLAAVILKINKLKYSILQATIFLTLVLIIKKLGFIGGAGTSAEVAQSLLNINFLLKIPNPLKTILYPLTSFYQMIFVPETNSLQNIFMRIFANSNLVNPLVFSSLLLPPLALTAFYIRSRKGNRLFLYILSLSWLAFILVLQKIFPTSLAGEGVSMLLGGFITFLTFLLIIILAKTRKIESLVLITILAWPFCFSLIAHLAYPSIPHYTITRYFTVSVAGICLLVSYLTIRMTRLIVLKLTNLFPKKHLSIRFFGYSLLIIFLAVIFFANFRMTKAHISSEGESGLYRNYIDDAFNIMNKEIGDRTDKNKPIVYLKSDNTDFTYHAITEGGEERFNLLNNNLEDNTRPFFVTTYDNLLAIFCDHKYNLNPEINDIFAFKISNKQIVVETVKIRRSLLTQSTGGKCRAGHKNETQN